MFAAIAASALVYWFFVFVILIALIVFIDQDNGFGATGTLLFAALFAWLIYDFNVFTWSLANLQIVLLGLVGYFVAGLIWASTKWQFFIRAAKRVLLEDSSWKIDSRFNFGGQLQKVPVQISENKSRYMMWMVYWPFSMIWTLIDDPVRRIFTWIYNSVAGSLQRSSNKVFEDLK